VGLIGRAVAQVLVQGFGVAAWLFPVELALVGLPLIRGNLPETLGLRIAGDLIVAIVVSALLQVALPDALAFGEASFGGNVGLLFGEMMREAFSTVGSFLVGPTVVGLILIGRADCRSGCNARSSGWRARGCKRARCASKRSSGRRLLINRRSCERIPTLRS
jgi:S-DNA-T family DNA segregation ATPase FtsK/SpoIIIE